MSSSSVSSLQGFPTEPARLNAQSLAQHTELTGGRSARAVAQWAEDILGSSSSTPSDQDRLDKAFIEPIQMGSEEDFQSLGSDLFHSSDGSSIYFDVDSQPECSTCVNARTMNPHENRASPVENNANETDSETSFSEDSEPSEDSESEIAESLSGRVAVRTDSTNDTRKLEKRIQKAICPTAAQRVNQKRRNKKKSKPVTEVEFRDIFREYLEPGSNRLKASLVKDSSESPDHPQKHTENTLASSSSNPSPAPSQDYSSSSIQDLTIRVNELRSNLSIIDKDRGKYLKEATNFSRHEIHRNQNSKRYQKATEEVERIQQEINALEAAIKAQSSLNPFANPFRRGAETYSKVDEYTREFRRNEASIKKSFDSASSAASESSEHSTTGSPTSSLVQQSRAILNQFTHNLSLSLRPIGKNEQIAQALRTLLAQRAPMASGDPSELQREFSTATTVQAANDSDDADSGRGSVVNDW